MITFLPVISVVISQLLASRRSVCVLRLVNRQRVESGDAGTPAASANLAAERGLRINVRSRVKQRPGRRNAGQVILLSPDGTCTEVGSGA
jgi:hypothetical protein